MTIKQQGGIFGRNPSFKSIELDGTDLETTLDAKADLVGDTFTGQVNINTSTTGGLTVTAAGNGEIISSRTSGASVKMQAQSAAGTLGTTSNHRFDLLSNGAARLRIDTNANVTVMSGNLVIGTSGKGIDFSATSGTGTSELFDDYEEGTWTPVISDANSGGNLGSAVITDATYTKIGRTVVLGASLTNIDTTGMTSTNVLWIQGLPFTSAAATYAVGNVKVDTVTFPASRTYIYCQVGGGVTYMNFQVAGSGIAEDNLDAQHISSGVSDIQFSITYTAT